MTPCQCAEPGYCRRHACQKPECWWKLCQTREDYFQLWEEGRGPGQIPSSLRGPGLLRRIWNYGWALWRHLKNRRLHVSREIYRERLAICQACSSFQPRERICLEHCCGCPVKTKARWASEACPRHKWNAQARQPMERSNTVESQSLSLTVK